MISISKTTTFCRQNKHQGTAMSQPKKPFGSQYHSKSRPSTRRTSNRSKTRRSSSVRNYKLAGLSFVLIGLLIGSLGTLLFWQQADALSNKGWTYVGMASQYQDKTSGAHDTTDKRVIVNVYACKQSTEYETGPNERFTIKSYATIVHNSTNTSYQNPRLEVLAGSTTLKRYSVGEAQTLSIAGNEQIKTPYTEDSFKEDQTLYYGFNNYYLTQEAGSVQYAIGSVSKLLTCE